MRLQIEKAVYGGAGLAHQTEGDDAGRAVFVPFTLPGETVEAKLAGEKDGFREALLLQVLTPSVDRIKPGCAHFGECGGCHYQHAKYAAQVAIKIDILRETLQRAGLDALPEVRIHSAEPWGYRNRTRLRLAEVEGVLRIGYNRRSTNEFLAIHECPILAPLLWRAADALIRLATENSAAGRWARGAVEVEFFTDADEKKLQMTVFVQKDRAGFSGFCGALSGRATGSRFALRQVEDPRAPATCMHRKQSAAARLLHVVAMCGDGENVDRGQIGDGVGVHWRLLVS